MNEIIYTAKVGDNSYLFLGVMSIYMSDGNKVLDMTYGNGVFWKKIDTTKIELIKNDIDPDKGDVHYDFLSLPFDDSSFDIVVFDPPYGNNSSSKKGVLSNMYNNAKLAAKNTVSQMLGMYFLGIQESYRLLKPGGYLMVKCMDEISGGKQKRNHIDIWFMAKSLRFIDEDLFILIQKNSPIMRHDYQLHARKNNSFLWVFRKR